MNIENECQDARQEYEKQRRSGQLRHPLIGSGKWSGAGPDVDNLETALLNDELLDGADNIAEDAGGDLTQVEGDGQSDQRPCKLSKLLCF